MVAILAGFLILAVVGPLLWGDAAEDVDLEALAQGSSAAHPFGTDALGRDMLARTLVATRLSLLLAILVTVCAFVLGVVVGVVPYLMGRRVRRWVANANNLLIAFPSILLALLVIAVVGTGWHGAVIALALAGTPQIARVMQTLAAQIADSDFVSAARGLGVRWYRIVWRHLLPNIAAPVALHFAMGLGSALLALSALSYLGVGVQEPDYDWGALLGAGLDRIYVAPAAALGPAAAIVLVSLSFNVLGDALAEAFAVDDAQSTRHAEPPRKDESTTTQASRQPDEVLRVEGLSVSFPTAGGTVTPVRGVSFAVRAGERLGMVGESGSGKSLTAQGVAGLIEPPGVVDFDAISIDGTDPRSLRPAERDRLFATSMAVVFQDPLSSFNPVLRVGRQVSEAAVVHLNMSRDAAVREAAERFRQLGIAGAARRLEQYPHELSGGMRQRAIIAMGLMTRPRVILADEPTTALDVTVQRQVLRTLYKVNGELDTAIVLISHDIGVVRAFCERVIVMYSGRVVEELPTARLTDAAHPYTRALIAAVPDMETDREQPLASIPGSPATAHHARPGCAFAPRCSSATEICHEERPELSAVAAGQSVACWHPHELAMAVRKERP